jgi:hypothetical protein
VLKNPDETKSMLAKAQTIAIKKYSHLTEIEQIEKVFMEC